MENIGENIHNKEIDLSKCTEIINTANNVNNITTQNECINDQTNDKVIEMSNDSSVSYVNNLSLQRQGKYAY
jgi:hypothetical protein